MMTLTLELTLLTQNEVLIAGMNSGGANAGQYVGDEVGGFITAEDGTLITAN